jgi:acetoin utilization protein AcuC
MLHAYYAFNVPNVRVVRPRLPTDDELAMLHTERYIDAVRRLSQQDKTVDSTQFGFGPGDNPVFSGMFESEALKVGAALVGAELLLKNEADVTFSFTGGLHHAGRDFASGFCVFGDGAIAITRMLAAGWRVAYIDIDAHHGDGVQAAFYDDNRVLTISFHESGRFLFPGTGFIDELGTGDGYGYSVNVPFLPFTDDETFLWTFDQLVPPLVNRFAPDVVVAQLGVDAHWRDPLTNLALTTQGFEALFQRIHRLSPRWLAVGGGGYDRTVVPRAWTLAWGVMSDQTFSNELPEQVAVYYNPPQLHDVDSPSIPVKQWQQARAVAEGIVTELQDILNL